MSQEIKPIQYRTVSDSVYGWIKDAIVQGTFQPGEHIAQERLTEMLGVSRTPVRDAMKRLDDRERRILSLRFYEGKTQMEVSAEVGISQAQVSRLEKGAINTIKKNI